VNALFPANIARSFVERLFHGFLAPITLVFSRPGFVPKKPSQTRRNEAVQDLS
jgi:hypothetical protein